MRENKAGNFGLLQDKKEKIKPRIFADYTDFRGFFKS